MNSREWYKKTFDHIKMSGELKERIQNMKPDTKKIKHIRPKQIAAAAAAVCFIFVLGEAAVYASTGETIANQILIYMNGKLINESSDPSVTSKTWTDIFGRRHVVVKTAWGTTHKVSGSEESDTEDTFHFYSPVSYCVEERQERICLLFGDYNGNNGSFEEMVSNLQEIDITEEISDGEAAGILETKDGAAYQYKVTVLEDGSYEADVFLAEFPEEMEN